MSINRINAYNIEPGVYEHHLGGLYVVTDILTHLADKATGTLEILPDPIVVYRDADALPGNLTSKKPYAMYGAWLSNFKKDFQQK